MKNGDRLSTDAVHTTGDRLSSNKKQNSYMTTLFRRLKPSQKFRITLYA